MRYPLVNKLGRAGQIRFESQDDEMREVCAEVNAFCDSHTFASSEQALARALDVMERTYASRFRRRDGAARYAIRQGLQVVDVNDDDVVSSHSTTSPTSRRPDLIKPLSLSRQHTSDLARPGDERRELSASRRRIVREVYEMLKRDDVSGGGIEITPDEQDPFHLHVTFQHFSRSSRLAQSLRAYVKAYPTRDARLRVDVVFPHDYPKRPPTMRLVRPILINGTGGVDNGLILLPVLFPDTWTRRRARSIKIADVLERARALLVEKDAEVDVTTNGAYDKRAFDAVYDRYVTRPTILRGAVSYLDRTYDVMSETEAKRVLGRGHVPSLAHGNKVLLPGSDFASFQRKATERGDAKHFIGEHALTFETCVADGPLKGTKAYCGVLQWSAPPGHVVVPDSMLSAMGGEGRRVRVRHVVLPQVDKVALMPHSAETLRAINDSIGARLFLELAVAGKIAQGGGRGYTTLQIGQNISLKAGGHRIDATVTSLRPRVPAVTLWSDYSADMPLEFLEPRNRRVEEEEEGKEEEKRKKKEKKEADVKKKKKNDRVVTRASSYSSRAPSITVSVRSRDGLVRVKCNPSTPTSEIYDAVSTHVGDVPFQLVSVVKSTPLLRSARRLLRDTGLYDETKVRAHVRLYVSRGGNDDEDDGTKRRDADSDDETTHTLDGFDAGQRSCDVRLHGFGEDASVRVVFNASQMTDDLLAFAMSRSTLKARSIPSRLYAIRGERRVWIRPGRRLGDVLSVGSHDDDDVKEEVEPSARCDACSTTDDVRTYVVNWSRLGLCRRHRCDWLSELVDSGAYGRENMGMLTKSLVLANLNASLM